MSEISLIMPVYNAEKYLSKALESILRQTFQNFELICIDDGSTDDSRQILSLYADKDERIKVVFKKTKGQEQREMMEYHMQKVNILYFLMLTIGLSLKC